MEAELEELRKVKEKANSEASAALEAGKSAALKDYIEEVPNLRIGDSNMAGSKPLLPLD